MHSTASKLFLLIVSLTGLLASASVVSAPAAGTTALTLVFGAQW
jgi:hypothetical protein